MQRHAQATGVVHHVYLGGFQCGVNGVGAVVTDSEDSAGVAVALGGHGREVQLAQAGFNWKPADRRGW